MTAEILVVDDEPAVRTTLRSMLEHLGHKVAEARDGDEALRILRQRSFALAIVDILMPEKDGLEFILHSRRLWPELQTIAISGAGNEMFLDAARGLGARHVLQKPFDLQQLTKVITPLLVASA